MKKPLIFVAILGIILAVFTPIMAPGKGEGDFLAYWCAARLMVTGGNPYDQSAMEAMQRANRSTPDDGQGVTLGPWNPPWLSLILLPYSLLPFKLAAPLWMFTNIMLIGLSVILSLRLLDRSAEGREFLWIFIACLFYGETISLINMGQVSSLVLLGLVLGIYWLRQGRDYLAGAAFLLATIKPHLSYLALFTILIYVLSTRRWKAALGLAAAGAASTLIAWILFPDWLAAYFTLVSSTAFSQLYTSTLGSFIDELFGFPYLRYAGLLTLPLAWPLLKISVKKGWLTALNLALLISVPLAPFGYSFDQAVLIPAVIQILLWISEKRLPAALAWGLAAWLILADLVLLGLLTQDGLPYFWFFWVPLALLAAYLIGYSQDPFQPATQPTPT